MTLEPKPTAAEVRAFMEFQEVGLLEAKEHLTKAWRKRQYKKLRQELNAGLTFGGLQGVLLCLIDLLEDGE